MRLLIAIYLIGVGISSLQAQPLGDLIVFGDSLYQRGKYEASLNEYNRARFFSDEQHLDAINSKIADCYFALGDFAHSLVYYDSAISITTDAEVLNKCQILKIESIILEDGFIRAIGELKKMDGNAENNCFAKRIAYLTAICYFGIDQFDSAFIYFQTCLESDDSCSKKILSNIQGRLGKLRKPDPVLASILSGIAPGAGQAYSGNWRAGINSIGLLASIAFFGFYTPFVDGFFVIPFLYRYYMGGILHANDLACRRKIEKKSGVYQEIAYLFKEKGPTAKLFLQPEKIPPGLNHQELPVTLGSVLTTYSFRFYKRFVSSQDVDACVFEPSCSVYSYQAIGDHGVFKGMLMGLDRLMRCHSFVNENEYPRDPYLNKYEDAL